MKIKKLLLIAPFASTSIAFVAARCGKGNSAVPEIINTGASRIEVPADENTETNSTSTLESSGSTSESSSAANTTNSTTTSDDNKQEAPKNNESNSQTSSNVEERIDNNTYTLNNMNDMPQRDEPKAKENIMETPSISSEEAKKYQKKIENIWKKHKYGFASFHTFDDVLNQLKVYVGEDIAKFLLLADKNKSKDFISKENPKKTIELKIGDENFTLKFGDIQSFVPTIYSFKGKENEEHFFSDKNINKLEVDDSKKIIIKQLGYYKSDNGESIIMVTVPKNTVKVPDKLPLKINSLFEAFKGLKTDKVENLDLWDIKNVTNLTSTFVEAHNFNQSLENWNTINVTNMTSTFSAATKFNGSLKNWKTDNVKSMYSMFAGAENFNQDINHWNVKKVDDMTDMFWGAKSFNKPLDKWDVSNVTSMYRMFSEAESFNQDISKWKVKKVESMYGMFGGAKSFDQNISGWELHHNVNHQFFTNESSKLSESNKPAKFKKPASAK
ncbi:hypothetical protein MBOVa_7050 [Mycoplasmopsis bovis 8790]|nr:hypothetical protein MBOVa_7050 [Mycoplasmopsis bovis 8790]